MVDNIVGAGGILAAQNVARVAPDGYTILVGASTHIAQKAMSPAVKFDPVKDFVHITRSSYTPQVLIVAADSPYKSIDDLVAAAKRAPGKYFLHGLLTSVVNSVWITVTHATFFDIYAKNNPQFVQSAPPGINPRVLMIIMGPIFGVLFGLVAGLFAFIASKIVKKGA